MKQTTNYLQGSSHGLSHVSVDTVRVLDLTGDWSLDDSLSDGGHGAPLPEALTNTKCGELLQLGCE